VAVPTLDAELEPPHPARDGAAIWLVRIAELAAERGFFVADDKPLYRNAEECGIAPESHAVEGCCLAK
jgi:hypothetical protein